MEKTKKIKECFHSCPFFQGKPEMSCNHPYWDDKDAYSNLIITQDNSRNGNIPEKCPLKKENLTIIYTLENGNTEN